MESTKSSDSYPSWLNRILIVIVSAISISLLLARLAVADVSTEYPISIYPDVVFVPVSIDGKDHLCIVDSGSTGNIFHTSLRAILGDPKGNANIALANGTPVKAAVFAGPQASVGTIKLGEDAQTSCLDLSVVREAEGQDIEALMGMPLFRCCILQMDFDAHRLLIQSLSATPRPDWGDAFNISFSEARLPTIRVAFSSSVDDQCIVDTAFTGSLSLASNVYATLLKKGLIVAQGENSYALASGIRTVRQGHLRYIKLGQIEKHDVLVTDGGKFSRLGLALLRQFRVTFDIPHDRIYLAKGSTFDKPDKESAVGIGLVRKNAKTVVTLVQPQSPAAKVGILADDELLSVSGESIAGRPLAEIRWMLRERADASGRVHLVFRRGGGNRNVVVRIRD